MLHLVTLVSGAPSNDLGHLMPDAGSRYLHWQPTGGIRAVAAGIRALSTCHNFADFLGPCKINR